MTTKLMLEINIFKAMDHIHLVPRIILNESLKCGFTFYITWLNDTPRENLSLYFYLIEGMISYLKLSVENVSPAKKNKYGNR